MAGVIKSIGPIRVADGATFNFDDMAAKATLYLEQMRVQAAQILAQAGKDAAGIRARAEQEGKAAGLKIVDKMVEEQVARHTATLLPALKQAVAEIQQAKLQWLKHWERQAIRSATAIAGKVIRREVRQAPEITLALVREALELAAGAADVQLQLHPQDHAALGEQTKQLVAELGKLGAVAVVANDRVSPGGCRVETRFGVIDQAFETQLGRIEEELA